MSNKKTERKLLKKAVERLMEAEDALDDVTDAAAGAWLEAESGTKRREKLSKVHDKHLALSGLVYELRRLVENL